MTDLDNAWTWVESIIRRYRTQIGGTHAKVKPNPYASWTGQDLADYCKTKGYEARYIEELDYVEVELPCHAYSDQLAGLKDEGGGGNG